MTKPTPPASPRIHPLACKLALLKNELHAAGLHATAQRMDFPLVAVGFELANDLMGLLRYEKTRHADNVVIVKRPHRAKGKP